MNSIAQELNGKRTEKSHFDEFLPVIDPTTLIYTFKDGSKAKVIQGREPCDPYIAATTTTMSSRPTYTWKAYD